MDAQRRKSIEFDIQQLQEQLDEINKKIEFKKEQNSFAKKGGAAVGISGAAIANFLFRQGLSKTPLGIPMAIASLYGGTRVGAELTDATSTMMDNELIPLMQDRDRILAMIKERKQTLNEP